MPKEGKGQQKKKSWVRDVVEVIITAFLLAFVIKVFVFELYRIPSGSMIPTLLVGDRIVVVKYVYGRDCRSLASAFPA